MPDTTEDFWMLFHKSPDEVTIGDLAQVMVGMHKTQQQFIDSSTIIDRKYTSILAAFPGSDIEGHRRYHEMQIALLEERRKLRAAIQEKTISGLVWMFLMGVGAFIVLGVKTWLNTVVPNPLAPH